MVVLFVLVDVMNHFLRHQRSPENSFGHDTMLVPRAILRIGRAQRRAPLHVAISRTELMNADATILLAKPAVEPRIAPSAEQLRAVPLGSAEAFLRAESTTAAAKLALQPLERYSTLRADENNPVFPCWHAYILTQAHNQQKLPRAPSGAPTAQSPPATDTARQGAMPASHPRQ